MKQILIILISIKLLQIESLNYNNGLKLPANNAKKSNRTPLQQESEEQNISSQGEFFRMDTPRTWSKEFPENSYEEGFSSEDKNYTEFGSEGEFVENDFEGYIMGGNVARKKQFPYQVSLLEDSSDMHICSGVIVNKYHVITAGHCLCNKDSKSANQISLIAGQNDLNQVRHRKYFGKRKFCHPGYDFATKNHDIAILRTKGPFTLSENIHSISLSRNEIEEGLPVTVSGWGDGEKENEQSMLQYINTQIISFNKCYKLLKRYQKGDYLKGTNICTYNKDTKACSGDAGGPVVLNNLLIGIVSWSLTCNDDTPGVHTGIESHYTWIQYTLEEDKKRIRQLRKKSYN